MSTMTTLGLRIPEQQKKKLEERIEEEGYPSISEYIRELVRNDLREEKLKEKVAKEIKRRKEQVKSEEITFEDMRTMEEIAEEEGFEE